MSGQQSCIKYNIVKTLHSYMLSHRRTVFYGISLLVHCVLFFVYFRMYTNGINPKIKNIYPKVTFPVSRGTPCIQNLPFWDHNEQWTPVVTKNSQVILHIRFKFVHT